MGQRGTFIPLYTYIIRINNLSSHLKKLKKEEQKKPKVSRKKGIVKRKAYSNKNEIQKIRENQLN